MTEKITAEEFVKKLYETHGNDLVIRHNLENDQVNLRIISEGSIGKHFVIDVYPKHLSEKSATKLDYRDNSYTNHLISELRLQVNKLIPSDAKKNAEVSLMNCGKWITIAFGGDVIEQPTHEAVVDELSDSAPKYRRKLNDAQNPFLRSKAILTQLGLEPDLVNQIIVDMATAGIIHYESDERPA